MSSPRLTFFCELDAEPLQALLTERILTRLAALNASISLGLLDLSPQRAACVRRLNQAGIPVIAWLLLPKEQGYWFNVANAPQALAFYDRFREWTESENLQWAGVGLDIEPDIREFSALARNWPRQIPKWFSRLFWGRQVRQARQLYHQLVARIHADGYSAEAYQFPFIADERHAHTTLLQRLAGLVDLRVDREVWMIYTSFFRPHGAGILASYAPEAQAIALGVTGGGVEAPGIPKPAPLSWDELARDLRLAWHWCNDLYIFSLEGCVQQGFLERLENFVWDAPLLLPQASRAQVDGWRKSVWSGLWLAERLFLLLGGATACVLLWKGAQVWRQRRRR